MFSNSKNKNKNNLKKKSRENRLYAKIDVSTLKSTCIQSACFHVSFFFCSCCSIQDSIKFISYSLDLAQCDLCQTLSKNTLQRRCFVSKIMIKSASQNVHMHLYIPKFWPIVFNPVFLTKESQLLCSIYLGQVINITGDTKYLVP